MDNYISPFNVYVVTYPLMPLSQLSCVSNKARDVHADKRYVILPWGNAKREQQSFPDHVTRSHLAG